MFPAPVTPMHSVTYSKALTHAEWERLRATITHIWLHQARDLKDMVVRLRTQYGLAVTEKTCRTRLERWGLSTYKRSGRHAGRHASIQPVRRRKGRGFQNQVCPEHSFGQGPAAFSLTTAGAYQSHELVLYSVDRFIYAIFQDSTPRFSHRDLIRPRFVEDYCLSWQGIADLYKSSEGFFRGGCMKKFVNGIKKAHLELRILVSLWPDASKDMQKPHYHMMVSRFWRICHVLLKLDNTWPQYEFSFVVDFLIEFLKLISWLCGENHPFLQLLSILARASKAEMHLMLRYGVERMIGVMGPALNQRQGKMVFGYWTSHIYVSGG
ncbi:hypothetical protein BHE90_000350 [Fusarium euwallaceae]|uniref:Clr5 domain-containing protein n=2 Tax=Fusarium solani species complex TaxID=232080 RepID=A0A430MAU2_9HYPO|nr:hypothetical protein CEP51_016089 [Fusarium floridanum]RTE85101.1 hypothetical protein BHE90_000350 [Fusarium euwallaceae]